MTVAEKIKLYLVEHKIKQSVVSDETGINKDKLCLSLNGKRKLSSDEFSRIVSFLGVSADLFIVPKKKHWSNPKWFISNKKRKENEKWLNLNCHMKLTHGRFLLAMQITLRTAENYGFLYQSAIGIYFKSNHFSLK